MHIARHTCISCIVTRELIHFSSHDTFCYVLEIVFFISRPLCYIEKQIKRIEFYIKNSSDKTVLFIVLSAKVKRYLISFIFWCPIYVLGWKIILDFLRGYTMCIVGHPILVNSVTWSAKLGKIEMGWLDFCQFMRTCSEMLKIHLCVLCCLAFCDICTYMSDKLLCGNTHLFFLFFISWTSTIDGSLPTHHPQICWKRKPYQRQCRQASNSGSDEEIPFVPTRLVTASYDVKDFWVRLVSHSLIVLELV